MVRTSFVDRDAYREWERSVISAFWPPRAGRGTPSSRRKVIAVAVPPWPCRRRRRRRRPPTSPCGTSGTGRRAPCAVKSGADADAGVTLYPATDTGGLTNYRVPLGARPRFAGSALYAEWLRLSGRKRFWGGGVRDGFARWARSVPAGWTVRFHRLAPERRVLATRAEVAAAVGAYYERVFGEADGREVWAAVAAGFVTPNINRNNLRNEYDRAPAPPRPRA